MVVVLRVKPLDTSRELTSRSYASSSSGRSLDGVVEAHRAANATDTSPANRALATASLRFTSRVRPSERSWRNASTKGVTACPDTPSRDAVGDGLLDEVADLDGLGRRVREEERARP